MTKIKYFLYLLTFVMISQVNVFAGATMSVNPDANQKQAGDELTVEIYVSTDTALQHAMALLLWDSTKLSPILSSYVVGESFLDEDTGDPMVDSYGWFDDHGASVAVVGVGVVSGTAIAKNFNGVVATLKFNVLQDVKVKDVILLDLSADKTKYDYSPTSLGLLTPKKVDVTDGLISAAVTIVKLFNVSDGTYSEDNWELKNSVVVASLSENYLTYTNENDEEYPAGGKVTDIDKAKITLKVGEDDVEYSAASYGAFSFSKATETITWDGQVTAVIGHKNLAFTIPFTTESKDDNKYPASGNFTLTVNPKNNPPVISDLTVIAATEGAPFSCSVKIADPNGDALRALPTEFDATVGDYEFNLKGTWANEGDLYTFTTDDPIPYDAVLHTASANNVLANGCYYASWSATLTATDEIGDEGSFEAASKPNDYTTWIKDVDRPQTKPTFTGYTPAAPKTTDDITIVYGSATDEDGDSIEYKVEWACGSDGDGGDTLPATETEKGQTWQATITATTRPYGDGSEFITTAENVDSITIGNTAPTLTANKTSLFIRFGEATSGTVEFTIDDPDMAVDAGNFTVTPNGVKGGVVASDVAEGKFTVTFTVTDTETVFDDGSITVSVNDGDEDSNEVTIPVKYVAHQSPVIDLFTASTNVLDEVVTDDREAAIRGNAPANSFEVTVTATDPNEGEGNGIKSIALAEVKGLNIAVKEDSGSGATRTVTFTITTDDYNTVADDTNTKRGQSKIFEIQAIVTDEYGSTNEEGSINVTINDVDRIASAPTDLDLPVDELHTRDFMTATPSGAVDPDGDPIECYKVTLAIGGVAVETDVEVADGASFSSNDIVKKGDAIIVTAAAYSKAPYDTEAKRGEELDSEELTVANTAPELVTKFTKEDPLEWDGYADGYDDDPVIEFIIVNGNEPVRGKTRYDDVAEAIEIGSYADVDQEEDVDTVRIEVDDAGIAEYASITCTPEGRITVTRIANKNTYDFEAENLPSFKIIATDQSDETSEIEIAVRIRPVNTKPVVDANALKKGIEVRLADYGLFLTSEPIAVSMGVTDFEEETQEIVEGTVVSCDNWEDFLAAPPTITPTEDGKSVVINFEVLENPTAEKDELTLVFTVTDNGYEVFETDRYEDADTSDQVSINFKFGSSLWYPTQSFECWEHDAHQVVITDDKDSVVTTLIIDGGELKASDYYNQGCKGLKNGIYTVVAHGWTVNGGVKENEDGKPCFSETITVSYGLPGEGTVDYVNNKIIVDAPSASSYILKIYKDDKLIKTITKDFIPEADGRIPSKDEFEFKFSEAGNYWATVQGHNPSDEDAGDGVGNGPVSQPYPLRAVPDTVELAWPEGGVFAPGGVIYLEGGSTVANVSFSWPIVNAAVKYILVVLNSATDFNGKVEVYSNTFELKGLELQGGKSDFNWYVIAVDANGKEEISATQDFSLVQKSNKVFVDGIFLEDNHNDGVSDSLIFSLLNFIDPKKIQDDPENAQRVKKVDIQIAHIEGTNVTWFYAINSKGYAADVTMLDDKTARVTVKDATIKKGDIAVVRFYYTDGSPDTYTTYTVK